MTYTIRVRGDLIRDGTLSPMAKSVYVFTLMSSGSFVADKIYLARQNVIYMMYGREDIHSAEQTKITVAFDELIRRGYISAEKVKTHYILDTTNLKPEKDYAIVKQEDCIKIFRTSMRDRDDMLALYLCIVGSLQETKNSMEFSFDYRIGCLAQNAFVQGVGIPIYSIRAAWKKLEELGIIYTYRFKRYSKNNWYCLKEAKDYMQQRGDKEYARLINETKKSQERFERAQQRAKQSGDKYIEPEYIKNLFG